MKSNDSIGPPRRSWPIRWLWRTVAWFLELLYTRLAWGYDAVAHLTSLGQWWQWQESLIDSLPQGRLLEMGAGTGHLLSRLVSLGYPIYGLDRSKQMIGLAKRRLHASQAGRRLIRGDAFHLPFAEKSFNGVCATFPSDYFFAEAALAEMHRVLQPRGRVVMIPFALITGRSLLDRFAGWLYRITGQAPDRIDPAWIEEIEMPGFQVAARSIKLPRAIVLQVTLTKVSEQTH